MQRLKQIYRHNVYLYSYTKVSQGRQKVTLKYKEIMISNGLGFLFAVEEICVPIKKVEPDNVNVFYLRMKPRGQNSSGSSDYCFTCFYRDLRSTAEFSRTLDVHW